jgi:omega-3 fatty acid desaturase (delta-15 desaturase)
MGADSSDVLSMDQLPSLGELRKALPAHVFKPSLLRSLSYVVFDFSFIVLCFFCQLYSPFPEVTLPLYAFLQGTFFWGVFVLGHDCGHGSFSTHTGFNNFLGTLLHTFLFVPFHPWRLSHRHHHKNTGNFEVDEIFYPLPEAQKNLKYSMSYLFGLGTAWFFYLICGFSGRSTKSHFSTDHPLFKGEEFRVSTSLISLIVWSLFLGFCGVTFGLQALFSFYVAPLFVFASWLVITTFLHHTEPDVPWYSTKEWNYVRGNLSSVDRDYGVFEWFTHTIGIHQIHHLFPQIPHYHLKEATTVFRAKYPHLVRISTTPVWKAFYDNFHMWSEQNIVPKDVQIHVPRSQKKLNNNNNNNNNNNKTL